MKKIVSKKVLVLFVGLLFVYANTPVYSQANFPDQALLKKAQAGDVQAQVEVGKIYLSGAKGLPVDYFTAYDWFHKAELKNDAEAFYQIGRMHQNGQIGPLGGYTGRLDNTDYSGFNAGHPGADINYQKAITWYMKAAEQNHVGAQYAVANLYAKEWQNGRQVKPNADEAMKWYRKAADNGSGAAIIALYKIYRDGWLYDEGWFKITTFVKADKKEAAKWYDKAQNHEDPQTIYDLARELFKVDLFTEKEVKEAVRLFRKAAEQNVAWAMYYLGQAYEYGNSVKKDLSEAAKWYRKAAENGAPWLQFMVGEKFEDGFEVGWYTNDKEIDYDEAAKWFRAAGENGDPELQFRVGEKFDTGFLSFEKRRWGTDYYKSGGRNSDEAEKWYRTAGENGNAMMAYKVAMKFFEGTVGISSTAAEEARKSSRTNIKKSNAESFKWFYKAAMEGRSMVTPLNHYPYDNLWFINAEQVLKQFYLEGKVVAKDEKAAEKLGFTVAPPLNSNNVLTAFLRRAKEIDEEWNASWRQINPQ